MVALTQQTGQLKDDSAPIQLEATASANVEAGKPEVYKAGKDISAPILIHSVEPKVSKVARRANRRTIVYVNCYIEPDGTTSNVHAAQTMLDINAARLMNQSPKNSRTLRLMR